jgi:hypothetical protein
VTAAERDEIRRLIEAAIQLDRARQAAEALEIAG